MLALALMLPAIPSPHKLERVGIPFPPGAEYRIRLLEEALRHSPQDRGFDVQAYEASVTVNPANTTLQAHNRIRIQRLFADSAYLMLVLNYTIDTFRINGQDAPFTRRNDTLFFALSGAPEDTVDILYHGTPPTPTWLGGGMYFVGNPVHTVFTDNEPYGLRKWLAALDAPDDKVLLTLTVRVPAGWKVGANGLPTFVDTTHPTTWTFTWASQYPIASYLIHFAASRDFVILQDTALVNTGTGSLSIPIWNYVYTSEAPRASSEFLHLPDMLQYLSDVYGPYPFHQEKYGHTCVLSGWAMENQTLTAYLANLSSTPGARDEIIVHELGHQWWGDWVTLGNFDHIWLNEGFATYTEALYIGHRDSLSHPGAYADYIAAEMSYYLNQCRSRWADPILPPAFLFSSCNTYTKGGLVLHMLRGVMGDSAFFTGLRLYGQNFAYGNALTDDFRQVMESVYGQSLVWFFNEWITSPGFPHYRWGWDQVGDTLWITLRQIQDSTVAANAPFFRMPIRFRVVFTDNRDTLAVLWNEAVREQTFALPVSGTVAQVILDDGNWILNKETRDPSVVIRENPANPEFPRVLEASRLRLVLSGNTVPRAVWNPMGRRVAVQVLPGKDRTEIRWQVRPGVYLLRIGEQTLRVVVP